MIINHKVTVRWHGFTRKHYEQLGYNYTKKDEEFRVYAYELSQGSNTVVRYLCDYCGKEGQKRFDTLMSQRKFVEKDCCRECAPIKHREAIIMREGSLESRYPEIAAEFHKKLNKISPRELPPHSGETVIWKCSVGHIWKATVDSRTVTRKGCPHCKASKGERIIAKILDNICVPYKKEVSFEGLLGVKGMPLRYDFAVLDDDGNVCKLIEYDGPFHFGEVYKGDGHLTTKEHDKRKDRFCEANGIPLYRIPYTEEHRLEEIVREICGELMDDANY